METQMNEQKDAITFDQLDRLIGVEVIYTEEQLTKVLKQLMPILNQPTREDIQQLPNEGLTMRQYGLVPFVICLGLVSLKPKDQNENEESIKDADRFVYQKLDDNQYDALITWFSRLADLVCRLSYKQDWYRRVINEFVVSVKNGERTCNDYFTIMSELAFCSKNIQNPTLAKQMKDSFIFLLDLEIKRDFTYLLKA